MALPFAGVEGNILMPWSLRCTVSGLSLFVEAVSGLFEILPALHIGCFVTNRSGRQRPFFELAISFNNAQGVAAGQKVTLEFNGSYSALEQKRTG